MSAIHLASLIPAAVLIGCGIHSDLRHRRIANKLNLLLALSGLAMNAANGGWAGLQAALGGLSAGLLAMFLLYLFGAIGPGDAKFMAAIGAWLDWQGCLWAFAVGASIAGLAAVWRLARSPLWSMHVSNLAMIAHKAASGRWFDPRLATYQQFNERQPSMPYGAFLGVGGLIVLLQRVMQGGA